MTKNEKQGMLYLRQQVSELVRTSDIDRQCYDSYSHEELIFFDAQYFAYVNVLRLIDGIFFSKSYGE